MHNLWVLLFFSKITFCWKLFSDCCDELEYQGSIGYLSCLVSFGIVRLTTVSINQNEVEINNNRDCNIFLADKKLSSYWTWLWCHTQVLLLVLLRGCSKEKSTHVLQTHQITHFASSFCIKSRNFSFVVIFCFRESMSKILELTFETYLDTKRVF